MIFWIEKNTFQTRKVKFQKVTFQKRPKNRIFKRVQSMVFDKKIERFTMRVFLCKPRQKRLFFHILNRKEYFLEQKSKHSKLSKKSQFFKGFSPKDCFLILWREMNTFQSRKVKFQKRPKNRIFQRGQSMVFVKKMSFLPCGLFRQTKPEKIVF